VETLLSTEGLSVSYGEARALFDVGIELGEGQVLAVLGSNGAGKSTLGKAIAGVVQPSSGVIRFGERDITNLSANRTRQAGIIYLPEGRAIFPGLSVSENLRIACWMLGGMTEREEAVRRALAAFPVLGSRLKQRAGTLSGGEQQMLALARIFMDPPKLVIADEPSLGLGPLVVDMVFETLDKARQHGSAILLIEQFVDRALQFGDLAVILQRGQITWTGACSDAGPAVLSRYLGESAEVGT
jgi:branched-chain amino acid transport system ATP-binding protein